MKNNIKAPLCVYDVTIETSRLIIKRVKMGNVTSIYNQVYSILQHFTKRHYTYVYTSEIDPSIGCTPFSAYKIGTATEINDNLN